MFTLKYSGLHDKEGNKINISDPLIVNQRRSGHFLSFVMTVHPDQSDTKFKHDHMACRAYIQLPLYVHFSIISHIINAQSGEINNSSFKY